jgi:hypothetical protein
MQLSPAARHPSAFIARFVSLPRPAVVAIALLCSTARAQETISLMSPKDVGAGWTFNNGAEFPGATGGLTVDAEVRRDGRDSLKLVGDFTKGGKYVQAGRKIDKVDIRELSMWVRSPDADRFTLRINDASGQTHQIAIKTEPGPDWQRIVFPLEKFFAHRGEAGAVANIAKYESWGGAKDGAWHGPATAIYILLGNPEGNKMRTLWLNDVAILPRTPAGSLQAPAFKSDFEGTAQLGTGWTTEGGAAIDTRTAFKGRSSLLLSRSLENVERPCSVTSPAFPVVPGQWEIGLACKSDLHSPDSSYNAVVEIECLDGAGKVVDRITVADVFRQRDWQPVKKRVEMPKGVASARFHAQLNKTYGSFWIDELSAAYVAPASQKDDRISRVLFSTAQLGNLLFPDDPRRVEITVEAHRPLRDNQRTVTCIVRDYWGAEQMQPATMSLGSEEKKGNVFSYAASIDLSGVPLEVGRYYELHAAIPQEGDEPFRNYTSFAILPEAETKRYKPEEVPFTARNWDNRITEYIKLSDRLGVRICGLWGGWSPKPPYKPEAPGLDLCQKLGMGWLTTTPAATIERGKKDYDEQALRRGVCNLIKQFGHVRPMIVNLGNEPHGTGERVRENVAAYRVIYEEVKKVDAGIPVVATSVEPNEEYFQAGYGQWCDAYDFHIYETAEDVRKTIAKYRELMTKYGQVKPIWSTELGLNSQGMTRHVVAVELIKKFSTFFAAGGTSVSWFGLLYPDRDAKSFGSSGDSHNVFDCRYNRYCPRLDAIAYYNGVNAIAVKKFVAEKTYAEGIRAFLFRDRDNHILQVLWKEKGRQDVSVPLPGVDRVQIIRIDGSRRALNAGGKAITLSITEDPLLLLYDGGAGALADSLAPPLAQIDSAPRSVSRGEAFALAVTTESASAVNIGLITPPFWTVKKSSQPAALPDGKAVQFTLTPPAASSVREADLVVTVGDSKGNRQGELYFRCPVAE